MEKPKYTLQQYKKFNGQTVMKALQTMNYHATTNKLAKYIAASIQQPEEDIKDTVKRVLQSAVANGFLVTRGSSYQLPGEVYTIQTDSPKPRSNSRRNAVRKISKTKKATKTASRTRKRNVTSKMSKSKLKKK